MDREPLVTIVTPSFNSARYIRQAIESVLKQDYPRIEYIVIDAGSRDGTSEILAEYAGRLACHSMPDDGSAHGINIGFEKSHGSIFGWLSADDTYLPGAIGAAVRGFLENPDADVLYGKAYWIDQASARIGVYPTRPFQPDLLARECFISQPAAFIRSAAFRSAGMLDPDEKYAFDYDLWIRMAREHGFEYAGEYWANSRMHRSAITFADRKQVLKANMRLLKKHYSYVPVQWIYGYCCYLADGRDQFFEPLKDSLIAYGMSLFYGLRTNHRHADRFLREWLSTPWSKAAAKRYWEGLRRRSSAAGPRLGPAQWEYPGAE